MGQCREYGIHSQISHRGRTSETIVGSVRCVWSSVRRFGLGGGGTQIQCHQGHTDSQMSKAEGALLGLEAYRGNVHLIGIQV